MKQRTITGIILLAIITPIIILEFLFPLFQIVMGLMVIVGSIELIKMFNHTKKFHKSVAIITVCLSVVSYLSALFMWGKDGGIPGLTIYKVYVDYLVLHLFSIILLFSLLVFVENFDGHDIGKVLTIINYIGLGCASLTILRFIGVRFLVYLFIITMSTDTFAYLIGSKFGKHKLAPRISPKKSWEGSIGGTLCATVIGTVFALNYGAWFGDEINPTLLRNFCSLGDEPIWIQALILGSITLVGSILAQIGDLVASRLKRTYDIKDFGRIFPGHGGVLDRFDSSIFVALFLVGIFMILKNFFPLV